MGIYEQLAAEHAQRERAQRERAQQMAAMAAREAAMRAQAQQAQLAQASAQLPMLLPPTQPLSVQRPSTPLPPTQPQPKPLPHVLANTRAIRIRAISTPLALFPDRILHPSSPLARRRPVTTPQPLPPQCPATP